MQFSYPLTAPHKNKDRSSSHVSQSHVSQSHSHATRSHSHASTTHSNSSKKYRITDSSGGKEHFFVWQLQENVQKVVLLKTLCIKDSKGNPKINIKRGLGERGVNVISLSSPNGKALGETKATYEHQCCGGSEILMYKYVDGFSKKVTLTLESLQSSEGTMQLRAKNKKGSTFAQIVSNDETAEMSIEYVPEKFSNLKDDIRYNLMALAVGMLDSNHECALQLLQLRKAAAVNDIIQSKSKMKMLSETD